MSQHPNARLTPCGRELLCRRVAGSMSVLDAARQTGVSRQTTSKWIARTRHGKPISNRPSRPRKLARSTSLEAEARVLRAQGKLLLAPLALAAETGIPAHTRANTVTCSGPAIRASRSANAASNSSWAFASSSATPPPPVTCVYATLTSSSRILACAATWASAPSLSPSVE